MSSQSIITWTAVLVDISKVLTQAQSSGTRCRKGSSEKQRHPLLPD